MTFYLYIKNKPSLAQDWEKLILTSRLPLWALCVKYNVESNETRQLLAADVSTSLDSSEKKNSKLPLCLFDYVIITKTKTLNSKQPIFKNTNHMPVTRKINRQATHNLKANLLIKCGYRNHVMFVVFICKRAQQILQNFNCFFVTENSCSDKQSVILRFSEKVQWINIMSMKNVVDEWIYFNKQLIINSFMGFHVVLYI